MTAIEKKRTRAIRSQAIFLTALIYCSVIGGVLMYSGGGDMKITDKIKTYFQADQVSESLKGHINAA